MEEEKKRVFEMSDGRKLDISYDDIFMIFKGYRPRLMSPEDFRFVGKILKKEVKEHKKGRMVHLSKFYSSAKGRTYVKEQ